MPHKKLELKKKKADKEKKNPKISVTLGDYTYFYKAEISLK